MTKFCVLSTALAAGALLAPISAVAQSYSHENFIESLSEEDIESFERERPLFWRGYQQDGTIVVTSGEELVRLLTQLVYGETRDDDLPDEGYGSAAFYADVIAYLNEVETLTCSRCTSLEEMKAFADPHIKRIYGALERRMVDGESRLVLPPENGISKDLLTGLGAIDIAHKKRGEAARSDFVRKWIADNKSRIRIIDPLLYNEFRNLSAGKLAFSVLEREYPDGYPLFFDDAYSPEYRDVYAEGIRFLEQRYNISSDKTFDLRDARLDDLLLRAMDNGVRDYLQQMSCEGNVVRFDGAQYNTADKVEGTPRNFRRFKAIDLRGNIGKTTLNFGSFRRYQYLWDAGYRHELSRDALLATATAQAKVATFVYGQHYMRSPRKNNTRNIGGVDFPTHAECIRVFGVNCILWGVKRLSDDLASSPLIAYRFDFEGDRSAGIVSENPYTSADDAAFFRRGSCNSGSGPGMTNTDKSVVAWSRYDPASTPLDRYTSRLFTYDDDGSIKTEVVATADQNVEKTMSSIISGMQEGTLDQLVITYRDNMISGVFEARLEDWDSRRPEFRLSSGGSYTDADFYYDRVLDVLTSETSKVLYRKNHVPLIVEMHFDKNLPHGPFRLWTRVNDQKGELLAEGRHDYGLILGPDGSRACDRGRCL
ncbi:MAG: hypothetical protein ACR2O7_01970 [Parasphingorhabdus sp.]